MEREDEHIQSVFDLFNQHIFGTTPEREARAPGSDDEGEDAANSIRAALAAARARRLQPDNDEAPAPDESVSRAAQNPTARPVTSLSLPVPISHTSGINQVSTSLANPGRVVSVSAQDQASADRSTSAPVPAAADAPASEDILVETAAGKKKGRSTGTVKSKKQKPADPDATVAPVTTRKSSRQRS